MMLRRQEERRMKYEKEQEEMKEHIKFVEPIKLQVIIFLRILHNFYIISFESQESKDYLKMGTENA